MIDVDTLLKKYCQDNEELLDLLMLHSRQVAELALEVCDKHPELSLDREFIYEAAMLHDIGIVKCDAPGIHCYGQEPYIRHGIIGAEILRAEGLPEHARVAERHTGTGITREQIQTRSLPLPDKDYCPETIEEQVVCYADKFYSKSSPQLRKSYEQASHSILKFGDDCEQKFAQWHSMFA